MVRRPRHARLRVRIRSVLIAVLATLLAPTIALVATQAPASAAAFEVRGSVRQIYSWGHPAGAAVELRDASNAVVQSGVADSQGAKMFRDLTPGAGYTVVQGGTASAAITVLDPEVHPANSFYDAMPTLSAGFGYLPTRDGTTLSVNVTFPNDGSPGPWPVVVDYSGYDPSQPNQVPAEAQLYPYLGYVVVGVNLRGTTCSGGAFWFFEDAVRTDGYDVIENLANQPWSNGNVGMVGISYSGYSQLPVAATQPPHLRAITPLSPFSDGYGGILYPGGILNEGFALDWALEREADARPAAHSWVRNRINGGDTTCQQNQVMRLQSQKISQEVVDGRFNDPVYRYLSPGSFAPQIDVPTFLATAWQDEQTGGYAAEVATIIAPNTEFRATFTNGTHVDALGPDLFMKVAEFVDLYVGMKVPRLQSNAFYQGEVAKALEGLFGTPVPISNYSFPNFSTHAEALTWYEAQDPVIIRWENGGRAGKEGAPYATVTTSYPAWPIPSATLERWYLQPDGALAKTAPTVPASEVRGRSTYTYDASTKRAKTFDGSTDAMWRSHPDVHWNPLTEANSLSFVTPAFTAKTSYAGSGSADLWLRSSAVDTDLEVTLTEVRPDGQEVYIQSGWLRASRRALDVAGSTTIRPKHTFQAADAAPLPSGEFVPVRVEIFPFAHIVRAGSRLRVNIEAPGGNQPFWEFSALDGTATNDIAHSATMPSSVVISRVADSRISFYAPNTAPSCSVAGVTTQSQSLRNQPCRAYRPARVPTGVTAVPKGNKAQVSWTAPPVWAGGAVPTGYRITTVPGGIVTNVAAGATTALADTGTVSGPISFTVAAQYGSTWSPPSDASLAVQQVTPTAVTAKPGNGSAVVTWKAPVSPGSTVTGYRVTPHIGGVAQTPQTFASTALTQTLTGLANGTTYTFTVSAMYGTAGPPSTPSAPLAVGSPSGPAFLSGTPGNRQVTLKWWAPANNGSPLTGYVITPYVGSVAQTPRVFTTGGNTQTVTGLTNGTTYTFTVAAVNASGTGVASTSPAVLVNPTVAGAPTTVTSKVGNASAVVTWKAPANDGGSPITGYVVTPYLGTTPQTPRAFTSTALTQTITGLANGQDYTFVVSAVNAVGTGPGSAASVPLRVGAPSIPAFLSGTAGNGQVTLKWWTPANNGSAITSYIITPYIGSVALTPRVLSASSPRVITGLTNGTTYTFTVAAVNANGTGASARTPAITPAA